MTVGEPEWRSPWVKVNVVAMVAMRQEQTKVSRLNGYTRYSLLEARQVFRGANEAGASSGSEVDGGGETRAC